MAHWSIDREKGGFPVERATVGAFDLCVAYVGGEWQWLIRRDGRDIAEGAAQAGDLDTGKAILRDYIKAP
jgi:hypothetical protein